MDHCGALIVSAGSQGGPTRQITALESVISALETMFDGAQLWPRLAVRAQERAPASFYVYDPSVLEKYLPFGTPLNYDYSIAPEDCYRTVLAPGISVCVAPVSHGECPQSPDGVYESSAFFIRNDLTRRCVITCEPPS